jgi:hypothetical protein
MAIWTERCPEGYTLPEGCMCFTASGWTYSPLELLTINMEGRPSIEKVLEHIWQLHGGMLGQGDLAFLVVDGANLMAPKGYIVFVPDAG